MVDLRSLETNKETISKIAEKVNQAMRIRTKLVIQKNSIVRQLFYLYWEVEPTAMDTVWGFDFKRSKEGTTKNYAIIDSLIVKLRICLKNEKNFITISDNGLKEGINILKSTRKTMQQLHFKKNIIEDATLFLRVLEYAYSKMAQIQSRLKLEEKFLEKPSRKSFSKFYVVWEREIRIDKKIVEKLNLRRIGKTKHSIERLINIVKAGGTTALISGGPSVMLATSHLAKEDPLFTTIMIIFSVLGGICLSLAMYEEKIFKIQQEEIVEVKQRRIKTL